ncbi:hypothetical protein NQ317_011367 [Molorchus minor]|uniref:Secreted protein n=1 Tax=Molorchus minor TaxID=1323400 RepID=A0ABQ9JD00_9CUCU|nr:hypothetical protein NQ317_011367 [Molorchus minor]
MTLTFPRLCRKCNIIFSILQITFATVVNCFANVPDFCDGPNPDKNPYSRKDEEKASKASCAAGVISDEELKKALQGQKKMFPQGIPECGSDALRFTLISHNIKNVSEETIISCYSPN